MARDSPIMRTSTVVQCITVTAQNVQSSDLHLMSAAPGSVPPPAAAPAVPARAARRPLALHLLGSGSRVATLVAAGVSEAGPGRQTMAVGRTNHCVASRRPSSGVTARQGGLLRTPPATRVRSHVWAPATH